MARSKKIKLKGSSFFDKKKPLNKRTRTKKSRSVVVNAFSKNHSRNKPTIKIKKSTKRNGSKSINGGSRQTNKVRYLPDIIDRRYIFIVIFIILSFGAIYWRMVDLQIMQNEKYKEKLVLSTEKIIEGSSTPRGRIYDRNYNLLVDNKAVKTIYYKKPENVTTKDEMKLAYKISSFLSVDYNKLSDRMLKTFWYKNNVDKAKAKITKKEWNKYEERKINDDDIDTMIYDRITKEELDKYEEKDRKAAYIYYLMNKGYSYAEKIIKNKDVTDAEYAEVSENIETLNGFNTKLDWERTYPNGSYFRSLFGNVSSSTQGIPVEMAEDYIKNGYSMDDRVGISYLEYQYEKYLHGTKAKYKVKNGSNYELIKEGKRGNDVVLSIDINLQKYLEDTLSREVLATKNEANTQYYNRSFVIVANPKNGEILAMAGKQAKRDDEGNYYISDYTPGIITTSVTPGSIVKGASILVGYKYGAISIGEYQVDECIKIQATPEKCSWRTMGSINDIDALAYSSNVYQYKTAIKVGRGVYRYDEPLRLDDGAFDKYRTMYASFGLGVKTGIDLPSESTGYAGKSKLPGHLLDFSIGQYDNYTPIQISQYISTIANGGTRYQPSLLKEVYEVSDNPIDKFGKKIYTHEPVKLGTVDVEKQYMDRVREGFRAVVDYGLGTTYMGSYQYMGAGKTGTSQSFLDTDDDGKVDTETISTSFVGYAPYEDPRMSIVVISPDVAVSTAETTSTINKRLSSEIVNKYFEIYK
ncbi:MAG: penicillin-binding protein 2 [Bacilli bacterium]|nr:penicillin-binding protein 2 [Bacilli bacterium]